MIKSALIIAVRRSGIQLSDPHATVERSRMVRRLILPALATLSVGTNGCAGILESATPFSLTVQGALAKGPYTLRSDLTPFACDFRFTVAGNAGSNGDNAAFSSVQLNYARDNGQTATQTIDTSDLVSWFGQASVAAGEQKTATRTFAWSGPFTVRVSFSFNMNTKANGGTNVITVPLGCGMPTPPR